MRKLLISFRKPSQQGDWSLQHMTCEENLRKLGFFSLKEKSHKGVRQPNTNLPILKSKSLRVVARFFTEVDRVRMRQ